MLPINSPLYMTGTNDIFIPRLRRLSGKCWTCWTAGWKPCQEWTRQRQALFERRQAGEVCGYRAGAVQFGRQGQGPEEQAGQPAGRLAVHGASGTRPIRGVGASQHPLLPGYPAGAGGQGVGEAPQSRVPRLLTPQDRRRQDQKTGSGVRHAPPGQHRLQNDKAPDGLRDAGPAGERSRLMEMAASVKSAAIMLVFSVVRREWQLRQKRRFRSGRYCRFARDTEGHWLQN